MKNKKILSILISIIISILITFVITNFNVLLLKKIDRSIKNIDINNENVIGIDSKGKSNDSSLTKSVEINYKGYIKKLIIKYQTKENFNAHISYKTKDYYEQNETINKDENIIAIVNKAVIPINAHVNGLKIELNEGTNFTIKEIQIDNTVSFNPYLFISVFISLMCIIIIYSYFKYNLFQGKIEKLFFITILLIGSIFIIFEPNTTSYSWDDQIHFSNIFKIGELDGQTEWTNSSDKMNKIWPFGETLDTYEERIQQDAYLNENDDKVIVTQKVRRVIAYNEVGYVLPGIVFKICSILGVAFTLKIILTKFSILLIYSVIMYFAIKIIPRGKRIMTVFGLLPSNIFLATQFSYDSPITSLICLFVGVLIKNMEDSKSKINLKEVLLLYTPVILASFIKAIYIPLILLLLFIPKDKFNNDKERKFFKFGAIALFLFVMATFVLPTVAGTNSVGDLRGGNTSVSEQMKLILTHPTGYIKLLYETAGKTFISHLISSGNLINYGYVTISITDDLYKILLLLLTFVVITDSYTNSKKIDKKFKVANIIIILVIILLIWTALYLSFNPVGDKNITGVQNRYFIPLLMPITLISLGNKKIKNNINIIKYDTIIVSIITIVTIWSLFSIYFVKFCL